MNHLKTFRDLHYQHDLLHIGNVWNAQSAIIYEQQGYKALGTSSAAIADTLGYEDGEQMAFDELFYVVKSILRSISVPLTVDIEAGYGNGEGFENTVKNILHLAEAGVVGVNIEDSIVDNKMNRSIVDAYEFSQTLKCIKNDLQNKGCDIFLNIRTDSFLMGLDNPLKSSIARAEAYEQSGADGIFIPCVTSPKDIQPLVDSINIPINVMAMPNLPNFLKLRELGVKRVSSGPFIYNKVKSKLSVNLELINDNQSFNSLFL